ncbi:MAG: isoprenoid biosynthesis glyoxalase ElbB [Planctomycetia bacterium]
MTKIGVVLSGCGFLDGAEIHEAVLTLLALDRAGAQAVCMAPRLTQRSVVDHATGKETAETRSVLAESARIARGSVRALEEVRASELDGIVLPGGYGAAKNLCDFAWQGAQAQVHPPLAALLRELHAAQKPIGAWCIAPAVLAAVFRDQGLQLTIGCDPGTAAVLQQMGAVPLTKAVTEACVDERHRIVTVPAYMYDARIHEVARGIDEGVRELLRLAVLPRH